MTKTFSAASIYGIIDRMDASEIQRWLDWHKRLKYPPRFINVFTAARFNDAPNVLRQVRASLPDTMPVWRGYDGKDAWGSIPQTGMKWDDSNFYLMMWNHSMMTAKMAAGMWFNQRVKPYVDVIRETGAIIHLLNEAQPVFNAPFEMECIRILGEEGLRAGAFAWAAGTPDWPDYQAEAITEAVAMAAKYDTVVMVHEYAGVRQEEQNSLINRYTSLTKLFPKQPDVFLGEFALAKATIQNGQIHLDPDLGWREMAGVTEDIYNGFIAAQSKAWYLPKKASFSLYSWPDWGTNGSFGVSTASWLLDWLADASNWMCFTVEDAAAPLPAPTPAPVVIMPRPPEAKISFRARVKSVPLDYRNLRQSWDYRSPAVGSIKPGDVVRRFDIPIHSGPVADGSFGNWIYVEKLDGDTPQAKVVQSGYVWSQRITWEPLTTTTGEVPVVQPPVPPPQPSPIATGEGEKPPAPTKVKMAYSFEVETTPEMHTIIEQALMGIVVSVATLGQALAKSSVTLVTETVG